MKSTFQAGVDSIYDALVSAGATPESKSLADIITAINNIQSKYDEGYKAGYNASRACTLILKMGNGSNVGNVGVQTNSIKIKVNGTNAVVSPEPQYLGGQYVNYISTH